VLTQPVGASAPEYFHAGGQASASSTFLRGFGNWVHRTGRPGAKLDVKFGFGLGHSASDSQRRQFGQSGALQDVIDDTDGTHDSSATLGLKYSAPLGQGHLLTTGADVEAGRRSQTRVSLDNGSPRFADSGDNLTAQTRRLAGFAQDEWDINAQWGVNLGLRWEGIRTGSALPAGAVDNRSSVWSPVFHVVWRIPGHARDQLRWSLTHSYRAPAVNDLIALPALSRLNSPSRPDRTGNPDLKPELARGMDAAYEHYLSNSGIVSANVFVRDIDNLMRRDLSYQATPLGPRWVSTPGNIGHAVTSGVELEAKFQLAEVMENAPNLDLRSNYSRFWSHVDGIPGPDNRLDQQAKQTANLGLDYRMKALPLTLGASYNWTPATLVQTSVSERVDNGVKRQVDLYGLWKFSPAVQLRASASNLLGDDVVSGSVVTTGALAQSASTLARTYTVLGIRLEMKL
jgi:outer membrane receptor for ferrienterochelin and colicins